MDSSDTSSSDSKTTTNTNSIDDNNKTKVEITIDDPETQAIVDGEKIEEFDNGQPIVKLGKVELLLVILGYVKINSFLRSVIVIYSNIYIIFFLNKIKFRCLLSCIGSNH